MGRWANRGEVCGRDCVKVLATTERTINREFLSLSSVISVLRISYSTHHGSERAALFAAERREIRIVWWNFLRGKDLCTCELSLLLFQGGL